MILQIKPFIGLSVLFLSVFFSCGQTKKTEGLEVIPIEAAYLHPTTLKASDYFRKIRYVPLETNDHALVGSDPVVWISGDRLIVSSNQKQCLSFDKATGRFVSSIGHIGNDPEGSQSLFGWMNAAAGHVYFPAGNGRSVVYDKDGNFVGDQQDLEVTNGIYGVDTYDYLDKDILVEHLPATEDKPDRCEFIKYQPDTHCRNRHHKYHCAKNSTSFSNRCCQIHSRSYSDFLWHHAVSVCRIVVEDSPDPVPVVISVIVQLTLCFVDCFNFP